MEGVWAKTLNLDKINDFNKNTILEVLEIKVVDFGEDSLVATMPVGPRVHQPFGVLHGGASCVLAESVGSIASNLCLDHEKQYAAGLEINANHIRPVKDGMLTATARKVHLGSSTHIWNIEIVDDKNNLVCASRLTMVVLNKNY
jgi:1,4-dihydroxy-2-naphthoyl-CoA hydrolase